MKKSLLFAISACAILLTTTTITSARVWVVNSGGLGDFTTAEAAITAATSGDTLYFVGSPVTYGNFTVTKPLTLIGPGYFLNDNPNAYTNKYSPQISTITIESDNPTDPTRDLNSGAAGTRLIGLYVTNSIIIRVNNVSIDRCRSFYINSQGNASGLPVNANISRSFIDGSVYDMKNATVTNTIFSRYGQAIYNADGLYVTNCSLGYVYAAEALNSIFVNCYMYYNYILEFQDPSNVRNCVFTGADPSASANYTAGTNNIFSVAETAFYIDPQPTALDAQRQLNATSPGIGAGEGGVDVGAFGGTTPYVLSGIPPIPSVYEITAPNAVNAPDGLPVTIKVRANN